MKIMIHDICTSFTPNISPFQSGDPKKGKWQTVNTVKVMSSQLVYLSTLFLGMLSPLTSTWAHSFA